MVDDVLIRGVALRGEFAAGIHELPAGFAIDDDVVALRDVDGRALGYVHLSIDDRGDLLAAGGVAVTWVDRLVGVPFLAAALELGGEGVPAPVRHVIVSAEGNDPLQLPYRVVGVPESVAGHVFLRDYAQVRVVDQAHDVRVEARPGGELGVVFDSAMSHVEWRHRVEVARAALPGAVARGFGFSSWEELATGADVATPRAVLAEAARLLR